MRLVLLLLIWAMAPARATEAPADILTVLDELDRSIDRVAKAQESAIEALEVATRQVAEARTAVTALELELTTHRTRVRRRLQARARADSGAWLRVFLSAESPGDLARRRSYARRIIAADLALLQQLQIREKQLKTLIQTQQAAADAQSASEARLSARRVELEGERAVRAGMLRKVRSERRLAQQLAASRARERERLATRLEPVRAATGFEALKGTLRRPVGGRVVRRYGRLKNAPDQMHHGWFIGAKAGAPVKAVASGTIVFAGWYKGFGNLVIARHEGNYHTLYAHLRSIAKGGGERIEAGTTLGEVGDTGSPAGVGLYFELRRGKRSVNPAPWMR